LQFEEFLIGSVGQLRRIGVCDDRGITWRERM
jgi:hypothetical protein